MIKLIKPVGMQHDVQNHLVFRPGVPGLSPAFSSSASSSITKPSSIWADDNETSCCCGIYVYASAVCGHVYNRLEMTCHAAPPAVRGFCYEPVAAYQVDDTLIDYPCRACRYQEGGPARGRRAETPSPEDGLGAGSRASGGGGLGDAVAADGRSGGDGKRATMMQESGGQRPDPARVQMKKKRRKRGRGKAKSIRRRIEQELAGSMGGLSLRGHGNAADPAGGRMRGKTEEAHTHIKTDPDAMDLDGW